MHNFSEMSDEEKSKIAGRLQKCAEEFGGKNFFLKLLESIRAASPHPLMAKHCEFSFHQGTILWDKVIFRDKFELLQKARVDEGKNGNLLPPVEDKHYKNVLNLLKMLKPITFDVRPKDPKNGEGFSFSPLVVVNEKKTLLNPVFDAIFFTNMELVKKILSYEKKES